MKKIILLVLTTLMVSSFTVDNISDFSIVGKWQGVEGDEVGYFIFDEEGYAYIEAKGLKIGGKEFEMKGKKGSMRYEIDYSKSPMEIDFIVTIFDDNKTERLLCIAKKIDNDKILFSIGFNGERPIDFKENNEMIFNRIKE
ncbi:hypothetical protein [Algibacter luteus]|uniref:hypothetical protein n=1 Tax=Algibacter luteus TaxID=1178825 RepID=UPI00259964FD|nr:hypothetical protein [Algibacter luteus]WJJ97867.1 hypothetical protein O5O44_05625 [Algibacter luteus]